MTREGHVWFCEGLEVKSLRSTHPIFENIEFLPRPFDLQPLTLTLYQIVRDLSEAMRETITLKSTKREELIDITEAARAILEEVLFRMESCMCMHRVRRLP